MKTLLSELARGWEGMHSPEPWLVTDAEMLFGWTDIGLGIVAAPGSLPNPRAGDDYGDPLVVCDIPHEDGILEGPATDLMRENAARIVACINFCRGFSNQALESTTLREIMGEAKE